MLLLENYETYSDEMHSPTAKKQKVWEKIGKLQTTGYTVNGEQCKNKFKDLVNAYKKAKDHNNKSGNDPATCPFFFELDQLLGSKPNVTPVAVVARTVLSMCCRLKVVMINGGFHLRT